MKTAINVTNVSKTFRIYKKPSDRLKQIFAKKKKFYKDFVALNPLSFEILQGEAVGIVGRNGSGKSTLLQMIAGTLTPTTGNISLNGRVAALLELGSGFNPEFTGRENVYLNAAILGISRNEIEKRMDDVLKFADIGDFIDQPVKTYSSGMYVRLAFAVSVNVDPEILIVDEALSVGDGRFQLKCFEKIKALKNSGKTIIVVSHDLQTIRQICDRVILIDQGRLIQIGEPNEVVNHYTKILFSNYSLPTEKKQNDALTVEESDDFKRANLIDETITKEYRYGNNDGVINEVFVNGKVDDFNQTVITGEELIVSFKAKALKEIQQPIFAMTIKSIKGLEVYGSNTYFRNMPFRALVQDEQVEVTFKHIMRLIPGDYYISLGFVELLDGDIIPLDRRYDVIEMKILPLLGDRSFGIANLESEIDLVYEMKEKVR
ncbi:ABC transporter ATP-binding protein [Paenibacillus sp. 2TAB23]|uniref:ABC transporter ATP-binding protein n=1 Tax=Paenibacillus sp. 2TAB23 TaxID=3233004 RepID=UPI003F98E0CD